MNLRPADARFPAALIRFAIAATIALSAGALRADDAQPRAPDPRLLKRLDREAVHREVAAKGEGIHKISDGSICIKSGPGTALVNANGKGCGTGCNRNNAPAAGDDSDMMAGVFFGLIADPQGAATLGIGPDQEARIMKAYSFIDYEHIDPTPVLKLYERYTKAAEGKAKNDAEKALMGKVQAVGQAYLDAEVKKIKDVKALLTPNQIGHLKEIGAKMVRPFDKSAPVA